MHRDVALEIVANKDLLNKIMLFNDDYFYSKIMQESNSLSSLYLHNKSNSFYKKYKLKKFSFDLKYQRICLLDDKDLYLQAKFLGASLIALNIKESIFKEQKKLILDHIDKSIYDFIVDFSYLYFPKSFYFNFYKSDLKSALLSIDNLGFSALRSIGYLFNDNDLEYYFIQRLHTEYNGSFTDIDKSYILKLYNLFLQSLKYQGSPWIKYFQ